MKSIREHVERLFKDVPKSEQAETIKHEIAENMEEKVNDLMKQGKEEEDAINKTLIEFGDIDEIKDELGVEPSRKKHRAKLRLGFSLWGSGLIIALFVFMNFSYTPDVIWFVYPTFGVLWWPLSMFYHWLRTK